MRTCVGRIYSLIITRISSVDVSDEPKNHYYPNTSVGSLQSGLVFQSRFPFIPPKRVSWNSGLLRIRRPKNPLILVSDVHIAFELHRSNKVYL